MNTEEKQRLIEQSIQLETNTSNLYAIFSNAHKAHTDLWSQLSMEEAGHAALIKNAAERCDIGELLSSEAISSSLDTLARCNHHVEALIEQFQETPPSSDEAFSIALELEQSAGEIHYQEFMNIGDDSLLDKVFRKLEQEDKAHSTQLHAYMAKHGIPIADYLK